MARESNLTRRGDIWYFRRVNPTTKKREMVSTGCKDLNQAKRRKTELEKEQNNDAFGWKEKAEKVVAPSVDAWAREFRKVYLPKHKNPSTFQQALTHVVDFFGETPIDALTNHDGERLFAHLRARTYKKGNETRHYSKGSLKTFRTALKTVWSKAIAAKHLTTNPWKGVSMKKVPGRKRVLRPAEQPALLAQLKPVWQRAVKFVLLTGLRRQEVVTLRETNFDYRAGTLTVTGKGDKTRVVPLSPEAAAIAREQIAHRLDGLRRSRSIDRRIEAGVLWPYVADVFYNQVANAALRAELSPELTVHDLRRTFGSRCAASGVPMKRLQEWMGHHDIQTTAEFYVHTDTDRDQELMAALRASVVTDAALEGGQSEGMAT